MYTWKNTSFPDDILISPTLTTNMDSEIVQVTVADDGIYERSEQVTVSIASVQPASVVLIGEHHTHIHCTGQQWYVYNSVWNVC